MKNKFFMVIVLFTMLVEVTVQDFNVFNNQKRNKIKMIKPEKGINNFAEAKSKYKIFKDAGF